MQISLLAPRLSIPPLPLPKADNSRRTRRTQLQVRRSLFSSAYLAFPNSPAPSILEALRENCKGDTQRSSISRRSPSHEPLPPSKPSLRRQGWWLLDWAFRSHLFSAAHLLSGFPTSRLTVSAHDSRHQLDERRPPFNSQCDVCKRMQSLGYSKSYGIIYTPTSMFI